jgi:hypothetical protein
MRCQFFLSSPFTNTLHTLLRKASGARSASKLLRLDVQKPGAGGHSNQMAFDPAMTKNP